MKIKNNLKILLPILAVVIFGIIFLVNFVNKSVIDINDFSLEDANSYVGSSGFSMEMAGKI